MDSNGLLLELLGFAVLLRKLHSKQSACFMVFKKGAIYRGFGTSDRSQNDSKMNSAMEPLAERIRGLGWQEIEIINSDLGFSAAMVRLPGNGRPYAATPCRLPAGQQ
jgi:hypothetical protein